MRAWRQQLGCTDIPDLPGMSLRYHANVDTDAPALVALLLGRRRVFRMIHRDVDVAVCLHRFFCVFPGTNDMGPRLERMVRRLLVLSRVVMCRGQAVVAGRM